MTKKPVQLFYSYCHADEQHRKDMEKFLTVAKKSGKLIDWHDRKILPGQKLNEAILKEIKKSDIIVFLVSIDFLNSSACVEEWETAKSLADDGSVRLVSIIVRQCPWMDFDDMKEYLVLPTDGKPITSWTNPDEVWSDVFYEIKSVVEDVRNTFLVKEDFLKDLSSIEFCTNADIDIEIDDVFVFPNLVTYFDGKEDPVNIAGLDMLLEHSRSIIHGDGHSGKSKLCSHTVMELWKREKKAMHVDLSEISSKKPSKKVYEEYFSRQLTGEFDLWLLQNDKTVIFDNLTDSGNSVQHIEEAEKYFDRIIVSVSEDDYRSYFSDDVRFSSYTSIAIRPFTHVKQEKLIKKWIEARRVGANNSLEHGEIDQVENNINSIIIDNRIVPRYPFFILSILQTYEGFMPRNLEISAYGHCYHALILANLIKSGIDRRDDSISTCMNYASHLAYEMMISSGSLNKINSDTLEKFNKKYRNRFLIEDSILNRLRGKHGLLRIDGDGSCRFSLPYSYYS